MIWLIGVLVVLGGLVWHAIDEAFERLALQEKLRRNDARLASERWEVLQERHDIVIELIAQIAECGCKVSAPVEAKKPLRRPRPKAK